VEAKQKTPKCIHYFELIGGAFTLESRGRRQPSSSPPKRRFLLLAEACPKRARLGPLCLLTYDTAAARAPPAPPPPGSGSGAQVSRRIVESSSLATHLHRRDCTRAMRGVTSREREIQNTVRKSAAISRISSQLRLAEK